MTHCRKSWDCHIQKVGDCWCDSGGGIEHFLKYRTSLYKVRQSWEISGRCLRFCISLAILLNIFLSWPMKEMDTLLQLVLPRAWLLVFGSPVPRLEKDQDWTELRLLRTIEDCNHGPVFGPSGFQTLKTDERLVKLVSTSLSTSKPYLITKKQGTHEVS